MTNGSLQLDTSSTTTTPSSLGWYSDYAMYHLC